MWWTLLFLLAYSITVPVYWLLGHLPVAEGWLTIPAEPWYLVQTFTTIPIGLAGFVSCGGLLYFLCRAAGGRGSFEATFAVCAYSITVVDMIPMGLIMAVFIR